VCGRVGDKDEDDDDDDDEGRHGGMPGAKQQEVWPAEAVCRLITIRRKKMMNTLSPFNSLTGLF
jgi:hypothetical protein